MIFEKADGLAIYQSCFTSINGTSTVLAGIHESWKQTADTINHHGHTFFLTKEAKAFRAMANSAIIEYPSLLGLQGDEEGIALQNLSNSASYCRGTHCDAHDGTLKNCSPKWSKDAFFANILRDEKAFLRIEDLGSEVQYRCLACRNCAACRKGGSLEAISLPRKLRTRLTR